jgi:hypothetical protein
VRLSLALVLVVCACSKPRTTLGPVSFVVPEGFTDDAARAGKIAERAPLDTHSRVWMNKSAKMQLALSLARLPHQAPWDTVSKRDLLSEMVNQEMTAGEKANLKTVKSERRFEGDALWYAVDGDLGGLLATTSRTMLWLDEHGDCWHASAVCTSPPSAREKCSEVLETVKFEIKGFNGLDAGGG